MGTQTYAQQIREHSRRSYVEPARRAGSETFEILAGEVHRSLHLSSQLPNVCQTLKGRQFLEDNRVVLEKVEGPPSGQGSRVRFVYRFLDTPTASSGRAALSDSPLRRLRGIAKDVFEGLGGAEAFIRSQRETFDRSDLNS